MTATLANTFLKDTQYMVKYLMAAMLLTCVEPGNSESKPVAKPVAEDVCHIPIKIRKETTRIVFIDCAGGETAVLNSEITGPTGKPGENGTSGSRGPAGANAVDEIVSWCHHSPTDHINRTVQIKISDVLKQFGGYRGQADYPGNCGVTENKCACDAPVCGNQNPQVHHYFNEFD